MKRLSLRLLAEAVVSRRKTQGLTQARLAKAVGINRSLLSRLESQEYTPSVDRLFNYGNCRRDFTYVDDIIEGVMRVLQDAPGKASGEDGLPRALETDYGFAPAPTSGWGSGHSQNGIKLIINRNNKFPET